MTKPARTHAANHLGTEPHRLNCLWGTAVTLIYLAARRYANGGYWTAAAAVSTALLLSVGLLTGCGGEDRAAATVTPTEVTRATPVPESTPTSSPASPREFEIVTLLDFDAIKAIDAPEFLSADEVGDTYRPNEKVIGVSIDGDTRAYSVPMLSRHEIVNDTVGGVKIAVTW